ncbi:hypothetical protein LCGC14_2805040, partial [marine sediment metagenome]
MEVRVLSAVPQHGRSNGETSAFQAEDAGSTPA